MTLPRYATGSRCGCANRLACASGEARGGGGLRALMGEAARRRGRRQARLADQPWCIYCGGINEATTTDHMPPITIFDQRHRPSGLEFSACERCNSGGRLAEKTVGLISRLYPDPSTTAEKKEVERLYREFARNHIDLLKEMLPTHAQLAGYLRQQAD